jgi:hypothetical protein
MQAVEALSKTITDTEASVKKIVDTDLAELNRKLTQAGLQPVSTSVPRTGRIMR